jgi:hypothetical protein
MSAHDGQPTLPLPAPRHLHRKPLRPAIPDRMFIAADVPESHPKAAAQAVRRQADAKPAWRTRPAGENQRKRMVALLVVIATVIAVPALLFALLFLS